MSLSNVKRQALLEAIFSDITNRYVSPCYALKSREPHFLSIGATHINNLPPELVGLIFAAGQDEPLSHPIDGKLPFLVLASHICTYWRAVALSESRLWSRCVLASRPGGVVPLSLPSACFSRSRQHLLDVTIELKAPSLFVDPDDEMLRCTKTILPHTARLRSLTVQVGFESAFAAFLWEFRDARPLALERLDIRFKGWMDRARGRGHVEGFHDDLEDDATDLPMYRTRLFAAEGAPMLKHMTMQGIGVPWSALAPTSALTDLELLSTRHDLHPKMMEFREFLHNAPSLRRLVLGYDPVDPPPEEDGALAVNLPHLRELICIAVSSVTIAMITAPELRSLQIEGLSPASSRALATRLATSPCYPQLESLALFHPCVDRESFAKIVRALPTVTTFKLLDVDNGEYVILLLLAMTRSHSACAEEEPAPWPFLKTLQVNAVRERAPSLCDLVFARYDAALPLHAVHIPSPLLQLLQSERDGSFRWLRAYVNLEPCTMEPILASIPRPRRIQRRLEIADASDAEYDTEEEEEEEDIGSEEEDVEEELGDEEA